MKYNRIDFVPLKVYKTFYKKIHGGIDGYYEKTILEADIYEVYDDNVIGYFSVHNERGLTSLVVLEDYTDRYHSVFEYVVTLPFIKKMLFTENDQQFKKELDDKNITYEVQAYNFDALETLSSSIKMKKTASEDIPKIMEVFSEFVQYNNMDLSSIESFYYAHDTEIICFGALEPLQLNENRFCISMIVNDKYRNQGYGVETVRYLTGYLKEKGLECNARCYVLNEASRKTLLKSGLTISNKLYKVE